MPSRIHLETIEKSGLPVFDRQKISEKFGVSKPTLKNKEILLDHFDEQMSNPADKKTMRKGILHKVEQTVHNWILERFKQGIPVRKQSSIEDFFEN